ncbi:sigma-70 family RNA polymerase sigma factor [Marinilongibacter aquaticus]|uniref:RNA polymerase sigma factor n=1 Tax=Marinilongibacter aquaticus TaxID=2975157 RepID=UPI0021BD2B56|nr:sigma-70 family RNA polymerase sigma factor [Marinilongibacter aquaticus]UBM58660.1 sigma-70 family RNA polymerase sigma factor [Marinilongibacter aquaticus]
MDALWLRFCDGDETAFAQIVEVNYRALLYYGSKVVGDKALVEDCIHSLFLDLWEKRTALSEVQNHKAYIFAAFRNNLFQLTKQKEKYVGLDLVKSVNDLSQEMHFDGFEEDYEDKLRRALEKLPDRQKEALYLRYFENLSYQDIGLVMNLKRQAVANYIQYGLQKLRAYWQETVISFVFFLMG